MGTRGLRTRQRSSANGDTCDLCQEHVGPDGWTWVEEGWSLACHACIARITDTALAPLRALALTLKPLVVRSTQGEWRSVVGRGMVLVAGPECQIYRMVLAPDAIPETHARQKADAALIVAAVHAARELVAAYEPTCGA